MKNSEIIEFLNEKVEPLTDKIYGNRYRASAYLIDGTYLPCVVFQSKKKQTDLATRRFEQLKKQPDQLRMVMETFVAGGSRIVPYDIIRIEVSSFAWPLSTLRNIHGETVMAWTAFVVEMHDGKKFSYGTSFHFEFFDLPAGYTFNDIKEIHSGMIYSDADGFQPFSMERHAKARYIREKPFFNCYINGIEG